MPETIKEKKKMPRASQGQIQAYQLLGTPNNTELLDQSIGFINVDK